MARQRPTFLEQYAPEAQPPLDAAEPVSPAGNASGPRRDRFSKYRPSSITGGASATTLILIALLNATGELDRAAFNVLLPEIRDYFGVSLTKILTVTTVASVMLPMLLSVPIGYYADRVRRTWIIGGGALMWGAFSVGTAFAVTLPMLAVMRFGSGVGKTTDPAQTSLLADCYPQDRRSGVFAFKQLGAEVGMFVAPALAGVLAQVYSWQVPFLLFGLPSVIVAVWVLSMREPARGGQERLLLGLTGAALEAEEKPPGWTEGWRIAKNVRSLRRIWMALPFIVGAYVVIGPLVNVYYADEFGLSESSRGTIASLDRLFAIAGLLVGGVLGNRLLHRSPARVLTYSGLFAMVPALGFVVVATSPWLSLSVGASWIGVFAGQVLGPSSMALITMTIPARARSFAGAFAALFIAMGVLFAPFAGLFSDRYGPRAGILFMVPVFLIGAVIIASAGATVSADIRAATAAAAASQVAVESKLAGKNKILVCRDLDVHYGQVQILFNVDFDVEEGEIVALLGTNGAGKSTLLNAIGGVASASNGAIFLDGFDITQLPSSEHVREGVVMVPGGKGVFPTLSVAENLRLAAWPQRHDPDFLKIATEEVFSYFPILRTRYQEAAGNLSGGEQQMLALAQAFLARPKLLMIDELSLGLAPAVVQQLLEIVRAIHAKGTTIILVEQSVNVALTLADRAVFMEKGEVRFSGPAAELLERGDILRSVFLSGSAAASGTFGSRRRVEASEGEREILLDITGVAKAFGGIGALNGVDLHLREGEVLGIIGPNGAGKTTLFDVVSGFVVPDAGRIELLGDDITELTPDVRAGRGLARSFQDARLYPALSVEETILVALDQHLAVRNGMKTALHLPSARKSEAAARRRMDRLLTMLNLGDFRDKFIRELSTGTRRLVDLACVLAADPRVLLLDEPSSGIAQRETEEFPALLERIRFETGCSILIIEHDMQLISAVSDELVAMELGRTIARGKPAEVLGHPQVIESYLGTSQEAIRRSGALV